MHTTDTLMRAIMLVLVRATSAITAITVCPIATTLTTSLARGAATSCIQLTHVVHGCLLWLLIRALMLMLMRMYM